MTNLQKEIRQRPADVFDSGIQVAAELLQQKGKFLEEHIFDPTVQWILFIHDNQKVLAVERTYREGIKIIIEPTDNDLVRFRADPWLAWNEAESE